MRFLDGEICIILTPPPPEALWRVFIRLSGFFWNRRIGLLCGSDGVLFYGRWYVVGVGWGFDKVGFCCVRVVGWRLGISNVPGFKVDVTFVLFSRMILGKLFNQQLFNRDST